MAKPSLTNIILFYNKTIGRKELFYKKCNIWLISLEVWIIKKLIFYCNYVFIVVKYFRNAMKERVIILVYRESMVGGNR